MQHILPQHHPQHTRSRRRSAPSLASPSRLVRRRALPPPDAESCDPIAGCLTAPIADGTSCAAQDDSDGDSGCDSVDLCPGLRRRDRHGRRRHRRREDSFRVDTNPSQVDTDGDGLAVKPSDGGSVRDLARCEGFLLVERPPRAVLQPTSRPLGPRSGVRSAPGPGYGVAVRSFVFPVFLTVNILVAVGLHWYLWARLIRDPGWPTPLATLGRRLLVALGASVPLTLAFSRTLPRDIVSPVAMIAFVWMGACLFLFLGTAFTDVVSGLGRIAHGLRALVSGTRAPPPDPARRQLLARGAAGAVGVMSAGVTGVSVRGALADIEVKEVEVRLPKLPPALDGLSFVQLSDVHIGPTIGRGFIRDVVEKANALRPDALIITGDLVDGSVAQLHPHAAPLAELKARFGRYFVTGNHEYYSGADEWVEHLGVLGFRVLRNERVRLGDATASIDLVGVDDYSAGRFGSDQGPDLARALAERDPERCAVLLAHQPKEIVRAGAAALDLQISGHTHGGQLWPFSEVVGLVQPYVAGLYRHSPETQIYVSRGTGYWGPPMRLAAPAEITKIVLVRG
jgi:predicted MPP superfamily phosphohydrolase